MLGLRGVLVALLLLRRLLITAARDDGAEAEQRLLQWAAEAPGWIGRSLALTRRPSHRVGEHDPVRGLVVTEDVPKDTVVLYAPESLKLTLDTCTMPHHDRTKMQRYNQYVRSAISILHEKQSGRDGSRFYPYVASLPELPPRNMFYMPASELKAALAEDATISEVVRCPQQVKQALRRVRTDATGILSLAASAIEAMQHFFFGSHTETNASVARIWANNISDSEMQWACAMAISRNFNGELYPVADMLNHAEDVDHGLNVRPIRDVIGADGARQDGRGFITTRDIKAGEELRERYAFSSTANAQQMRLVYGIEY